MSAHAFRRSATCAVIAAASIALVAPSATAASSTAAQEAPSAQQSAPLATVEDFEAMSQLSQADVDRLSAALQAVPPELVQRGDAHAVHEALVAELGNGSDEDAAVAAVPLVILAARAVACLAPAYTTLRGITSGSPDVVAASIAGAVAGCVTGGGATVIRQAILANRATIAAGLRGIGLGGLAGLLTGDSGPATAAHTTASVAAPTRTLRLQVQA